MHLKELKIPEEFSNITFVFDQNGLLLHLNQFGERILGVGREQYANNLHFTKLFDSGYEKELIQSFQKLKSGLLDKIDCIRVKLFNNKSYIWSLTITFLNNNKNNQDIYCGELTIDANEKSKWLDKIDREYSEFLDNIPIGIYRTSIDGELIFANKGLLKIFGYSDKSEIHNVEKIFADKEFRNKNLKKWIEQGEYSDVFKVKKRDGRIIYVKDGGHVVFENGIAKYFDGTLEDITKNKQLEDKLQALNVSKNKFFSILSHDLKGAFGQFIGATDLILDSINEFDKEQIENIVKLLNEQAEKNYKLLENLLDWSKSQEGILKFQPEPINISLLFKEIVEYYKQQAENKSIDLIVKVKENLIIYADKYMLSTVLRNLISNAIKFTSENGQVIISAREIVDKENFGEKVLEVSVADSGVGMEKDRLEKLFNLEGNYSTKGTGGETGTGLGLILCKEFIEKHGGKIYVESEVGKGSVFKFTIP